MDYQDPSQKKAHLTRLFVGYFLVATAVIAAATILLYQSYGYDLNRKTGQVIQNGLLFVSSKPVAADIYLNGTSIKAKTDTKLTIPGGEYLLELRSVGYRSWKRIINLDGGSVERVIYPLLFPTKLATSEIKQYATTPSFATYSPDKRWMLVQSSAASTNFDMFDMNNDKPTPTPLVLPAGLLTSSTAAQTIKLVEWSNDNKHLLVKHEFGTSYEYIMIDRDTVASSYNVSKQLQIDGATIDLVDKRFDKMTVYKSSDHSLAIYDAKTKQVNRILQNVLSYKTHGEKLVMYSTDNGLAEGPLSVKLWDGTISYLMQNFDPKTGVKLDLAQYSGDWYMIVGPKNAAGRVYVYKNPQDSFKQANFKSLVPLTVLRAEQIDSISFSDTARYIISQNGVKFSSYDIETERHFYFDLKQPVTANQTANWMDGDRLTIVTEGKTMAFDFDGSNQQVLSASNSNQRPFFNKDYSALFNIAPSTTSPVSSALTRTELKLL